MHEAFAADPFGTQSDDPRTFFLIVFPQAIEDELIGLLDTLNVAGFTESRKVTGRGPRGRHFDTAVWPGADGAIFTVVAGDHADTLSTALANYNRKLETTSHSIHGLRVFTWACLQVA